MSQTVTYKHLVAGSVIHYQKKRANKDDDAEPVKTITFHGKHGGVGVYSTSDPGEIAELDKVAKNPQVQVERVEGDIDVALAPQVLTIEKAQPEEIKTVVDELQASAARSESPAVISAQEKLGALIAANKAG